jgi:hypothetical protein
MQLEINPPGIDADYLNCLNACFPSWGDTQMSQWAFRRALGPDPLPDLLVLRQDGELLAGSAVNYRRVVLPNGGSVCAGIMTGSWTLPAARGRGCFLRMIEESAAITYQRSGALLLAFVTEDNPSYRQLQKAGSAIFPTWYLIAGTDGSTQNEKLPAGRGLVTLSEAEFADAVPCWAEEREGKCRFSYSSFVDWKSQFVDRPARIEAVRCEAGSFAIVERHSTTDRIHAWWAPSQTSVLELFRELRANAQMTGRKLFSFSTDPVFTAQCEAMGFRRKQGYLTAIVTDWEQLGQALQIIASPVPTNHALLDPASHWFIGQWDLQAGDRM